MEKEIRKAITLRRNKHYQESNKILLELVSKYPDNASINYQCAWSFDLLGEETRAVPYYEKAIGLGLPTDELEDALLGLGSTYRTLGKYEDAKRIFEKGIGLFPDNFALQTFYAMTLYNLNDHHKAMEILLKCLIETTSDETILKYKRAIKFYSDKLDEVWK